MLGVDPDLDDDTFVRGLVEIGEISDEAVAAGPAAWKMLLGPYRHDLYVERSFVVEEEKRSKREAPARRRAECPILVVFGEKDKGVA